MTEQEQKAFDQMREALEDSAQTLAWMQHGKCRGFSPRLLTTNDALDKAKSAITAANAVQPKKTNNPT